MHTLIMFDRWRGAYEISEMQGKFVMVVLVYSVAARDGYKNVSGTRPHGTCPALRQRSYH